MRRLSNKGQIDALQPLIVALVVIAIVLVVGFLIFAEVQDQVVEIDNVNESASIGSYGYNATQDITNAMADIPGWLPIIVVVVIGALLIGLVGFLRRQAR
uniref:Uncharacterized protein n=1 Tax=viral metagenome TaxID=1070528 RepID=A0A6H1ZIR1_9ZZZZ